MRYLLLLLIALPLIGIGCDSAEDTPEFFIVALRNDEPWQAAPRASVTHDDHGQPLLSVGGIVGDIANACPPPDYCENLGFSLAPLSNRTGTYPLDPSLPGSPNAFLHFLDGDQIEAWYETPSEGGGFVVIDTFDEAAQVVAGTFEAVVVNQAAPFDTLRFEGGRFRIRYEIIG